MPNVETLPLALPQTSYERLKSGLDMTAEAVIGASASLEALKDVNHFPEKRDAAIKAAQAMVDALHTIPGLMKNAGNSLTDAAFNVLEGYVVNEHPITKEKLMSMDKCSITCDSLHHPSYLDPYLFAKVVRSDLDLCPEDMPTTSFTRSNPEDMWVVSILTRTYLYLVGLRENDDAQWFYGAMAAMAEVSRVVDERYKMAHNILEALRSSQFNELTVRTVDNPANEETFIKFVENMMGGIASINRAIGRVQEMCRFYQTVIPVLSETYDACLKAYQLYCKRDGASF